MHQPVEQTLELGLVLHHRAQRRAGHLGAVARGHLGNRDGGRKLGRLHAIATRRQPHQVERLLDQILQAAPFGLEVAQWLPLRLRDLAVDAARKGLAQSQHVVHRRSQIVRESIQERESVVVEHERNL